MTLWNGVSSILAQVRIFYQNIQSCVINNGLASEYFTLEQSVRQGDPLPTSLSWPRKPWQFQFEKILKCKELKLAKNETKPLRYADDTCVFCVLET